MGFPDRILWVDDQPLLLIPYERRLAELGIELTKVESTSQCMERLRSEKYDLIIVDLNLPFSAPSDSLGVRPEDDPRLQEYGGILIIQALMQYRPRPNLLVLTALDIQAVKSRHSELDWSWFKCVPRFDELAVVIELITSSLRR